MGEDTNSQSIKKQNLEGITMASGPVQVSRRKLQILLVADDVLDPVLCEELKAEGFDVKVVETFEEVLSELDNKQYDVVLPTNTAIFPDDPPDLAYVIRT